MDFVSTCDAEDRAAIRPFMTSVGVESLFDTQMPRQECIDRGDYAGTQRGGALRRRLERSRMRELGEDLQSDPLLGDRDTADTLDVSERATATQRGSLGRFTCFVQECNTATSEAEVLDVAARHATCILDANRASIALLDTSGDRLHVLALNGESGALPAGVTLPVEGTAVGEVVRTGRILTVDDGLQSHWLDIRKLSQHGRSFLNAPLVAGGVVIGTLNSMRPEPHSYSAEDARIIGYVAAILASNLNGRRLFKSLEVRLEEARLQARIQEGLYHLAKALDGAQTREEVARHIADEVAAVFDVARVSLLLLSEDRKTLNVVRVRGLGIESVDAGGISVDGTAAGTAVREGRAVTVRNLTERLQDTREGHGNDRALQKLVVSGVHSTLSIPLISGGEPMGTLNAAFREEEQPTSTESDYLHHVSSLASIAMDRIRMVEELERKNEALVEANKTKSVFLANMSHEIRTPMNGVLGMASVLLDTRLSHEQRELTEVIRSSATSLLTVINDILDFSKLEARKLTLEQRPFDVDEVVNGAFDVIAPPAGRKNLELIYRRDRAVPRQVLGDVTRVRQVLVNLLSNAVKFTEAGNVGVRVRSKPGPTEGLIFEVFDSGIGIPASARAKLFAAFSQVDASTTRKFGGTGLGLAICRELLELMEGTLRVESTPGVGSTFIAELSAPAVQGVDGPASPLAGSTVLLLEDHHESRIAQTEFMESLGMRVIACSSAAEALSVAEAWDYGLVDLSLPGADDGYAVVEALRHRNPSSRIVVVSSLLEHRGDGPSTADGRVSKPLRRSELERCFQDTLPAPGLEAAPPVPGTGTSSARPSILVADDNPVNQRVIVKMLERLGLEADVVEDGRQAVEAVGRRAYDIVLMDMMMPDLDGLGATRAIRARSDGHQPYIIALTANAMKDHRALCVAAGMDAYLSKPVTKEQLHEALAASGHGL